MPKPQPTAQIDMFDDALHRQQAEHAALQQRVAALEAEHAALVEQRDVAKSINKQVTYQVTTLQRDKDRLLAEVRALNAYGAEERKLTDEIASLKGDNTLLQIQVTVLEMQCAELRAAARQAPAQQEAPDQALLKRLLALAHPDKWSQGQPATELAHELSVAINAMRDTR